jgi:hypothetical protein
MKTAVKKGLGFLLLGVILLLGACSQTSAPTENIEAQSGGRTCRTAAPLATGWTHGSINDPEREDWYSGSSLIVPGGVGRVLSVMNTTTWPLRVETYSSCPLAGTPVATIDVAPGSLTTIPLPGADNFYLRFIGYSFASYSFSYSAPIVLDPCLFDRSCLLNEFEIIPDDCWVCKFDLDILKDILESYRVRVTLPELGLKPDHFAKAFAFNILTSEGKLVAQAKGNGQEAMLELVTRLPKGSYKLQVSILDQSIAKIIHANNQKYPFKFTFSLEK